MKFQLLLPFVMVHGKGLDYTISVARLSRLRLEAAQPAFQFEHQQVVEAETRQDAPAMAARWVDMKGGWDVVAIEFHVVIDAIGGHHHLVVVAQSDPSPWRYARHLQVVAIQVFVFF